MPARPVTALKDMAMARQVSDSTLRPPISSSTWPLHPDRILFDFISEGIAGTAMVGLAGRYTDEDIWHVINYIKTLE